jgi:ParB family chromosome partitioning protein
MTTDHSVQMIPIAKIRVINPRARSKAKFREILDNMSKVGLKMPITVSRRGEGDDGYDLVCGQGRLEGFIAGGATEIPALVVDIPLEQRLLRSLVENLARRTRTPIELARDVQALKERGYSTAKIATELGMSETYVLQILRLLANGEERLVAAVERNDVPMTVAIQIAAADDAGVQRCLQEAYERGELRGGALQKARKLIEERKVRGKAIHGPGRRAKGPSPHDLVRTLQRDMQKRQILVKKANLCEQQLRFVLSALKGSRRVLVPDWCRLSARSSERHFGAWTSWRLIRLWYSTPIGTALSRRQRVTTGITCAV